MTHADNPSAWTVENNMTDSASTLWLVEVLVALQREAYTKLQIITQLHEAWVAQTD